MSSATDVRSSLVSALHADLIGPFGDGKAGAQEESLTIAPSRWLETSTRKRGVAIARSATGREETTAPETA